MDDIGGVREIRAPRRVLLAGSGGLETPGVSWVSRRSASTAAQATPPAACMNCSFSCRGTVVGERHSRRDVSGRVPESSSAGVSARMRGRRGWSVRRARHHRWVYAEVESALPVRCGCSGQSENAAPGRPCVERDRDRKQALRPRRSARQSPVGSRWRGLSRTRHTSREPNSLTYGCSTSI
jgi:hypothetical protein